MKLASLKSGRDGRLVLVSRDLTRCASVTDLAPTMQAALDDNMISDGLHASSFHEMIG